jgi:ubiquinone/menaquinone biosynthesis C-methylase UbiE
MHANPQWQFVGNVPDNYERHLVPTIFGPWAHDLVQLVKLRAEDRVLDIACGTGIVARTAARYIRSSGSVVGLDLSGPMLSTARTAAAHENVVIDWQEGSAVDLPLPDAAFDVVFCQQGLQFFPDRATALSEMHRVLVPGGRLVLSIWRSIEQSPGFVVLAEALTRHISSEAGTLMTSGPFGLSDPQELRSLISGAGFNHITIEPSVKVLRFPSPEEFVLRYAAGSALGGPLAVASNEGRDALLAEVEAGLRPYINNQGLAFPIESNVAVGRKWKGGI